MYWHTYENTDLFLRDAEDFLLENEAVNNLPLGVLYNLRKELTHKEKPFLAAIGENNNPVIIFVMTKFGRLILAGDTSHPNLDAAIKKAIEHILESEITIHSAIGVKELAFAFANEFTLQTGQTQMVDMDQRIYKLDQVNRIDVSQGYLRLPTQDETELLNRWVHAFSKATSDQLSAEEAAVLVQQKISSDTLYLWDHNGPVSMANMTRPTKNGAVISYVYTPPEYKKKGYATSCVAALSQKILDSGYSFASLYTDLANPTSNGIYMKIGYQPIEDSVLISFDKQALHF
ncbi:hypothetical protein EV207_1164 [Scopulibacillus darangshiensis]|uniref:N-acetyltransferase domain-containing protein n=1 Tax=Scopulibacillus darangshiensis TaxID=442528 RepID=A0A4R2P3T2_9BACL|nr:GNAT family N-acetyltransferase [Scopulibacillus darangshiensis]TCP28694.1 hypothetical protein EV207_1164 [Scopulibacillus darangshiensis]